MIYLVQIVSFNRILAVLSFENEENLKSYLRTFPPLQYVVIRGEYVEGVI